MEGTCICCHHKSSHDIGKCPVCGFVVPQGNGDESDESNYQLAEQFRAALLADKKVFVEGHISRCSWDEVKETGTTIYPLAECGKMELNQPVWLEQPFARQISRKNITLTVLLQDQDKKVKKTVTMAAPEGEDLWYVGVVLQAELKLKFLVKAGKNSNHISGSEEISLLKY